MADFTQFFTLFKDFCGSVLNCLRLVEFSLFGYSVNLLTIIIAFLVIGFVAAIFWKGAHA